MKINKKIFAVFLLYIVTLSINCYSENNDSLKIQVLLSKSFLKGHKETVNFIPDFEITPSKNIILSSANQFYILGWGGFEAFGSKPWGTISSYEYSTRNILMVIRSNEYCYLDTSGKLIKLYKLPNSNMRLSRGHYVMYVYDRNISKPINSIYAIAYGGKYIKLLEVPKPIYSLVEVDNSILFTNENAVLKYNLKTKEIKAVTKLPDNNIIKSIAFDSISKRLFFSTDSIVYSLKDGKYNVITNQIGGELKIIDGSLTIFDSKNQLLVSLIGIENQLKSNKKTSDEPTTTSITPAPITTKTIEPQAAHTSTIVQVATASVAATTTKTIEPQVAQTPTITTVTTSSIVPTVSSTTITANPTKQPAKEILNNQDVIKMVKAKVSNNLIINIIKTSDANFDLKIESIIFLSNQGVSSDVIAEMKNAMDTKNGNK